MIRVAFLVHPRSLLTGVTIPMEMLRAADEIDRVRRRSRSRLKVVLATTHDAAFDTLHGFSVRPQTRVEQLEALDLLFVPPYWRRPALDLPETIKHLVRLHQKGSAVCAVSTGSFLLAEAGLLDGRVATTHWSFLDQFAQRYPEVQLKRHHLITRADDIFCAGSLNATADLTSFFIERWLGEHTARQVEAQFSPEIRQPAQQQGFFDGETNQHPDELMAVAQDWLVERLAEDVKTTVLAEHLEISQRSLNRRFREATGVTPLRFLQDQRVSAANDFLRNSNLSVAEIASRVGYQDAAHFSTLYRRLTGTSPTSFRNSVRAKLFGTG